MPAPEIASYLTPRIFKLCAIEHHGGARRKLEMRTASYALQIGGKRTDERAWKRHLINRAMNGSRLKRRPKAST
jgi:hypothetical protein